MGDLPATDPADHLLTLRELLKTVAETGAIDRPAASGYAQIRAALLASSLRPTLPGFLLQCGSLERFREFISLYHPEPRARVRFIDAALANAPNASAATEQRPATYIRSVL